MGIPPNVSALARKRLGESAQWDVTAQLLATLVDYVGSAFAGDKYVPLKRPYDIAQPPEETASLAQLADFLKG